MEPQALVDLFANAGPIGQLGMFVWLVFQGNKLSAKVTTVTNAIGQLPCQKERRNYEPPRHPKELDCIP